MTLTAKVLISALVLLATSRSAIASDVCDPLENNPALKQQLQNCKILVRQKIVRKDALEYTIKYWVNNQNRLQDPRCAVSEIRPEDRCKNCMKPGWVEQGIKNNCSFLINDLKQPWDKKLKGPHERTTGHFIDLCSNDPSKIVTSFYINGAKGMPGDDERRREIDTKTKSITDNSNSSVLVGAFLLNNAVTNDFYTVREEYKEIRKQFGGGIPAIRMVGLNSSNNTTEFDKPLHVSAFKRGKGCPGVDPEVAKSGLLNKIAGDGRGSSLYMSYYEEKFEQKGSSCVNDKSTNNPPLGPAIAPAAPRAAARTVSSVSSIHHRLLFDLPASSKVIRKMQVDLKDKDGLLVAKTKVLTSAGTSTFVGLVCHKLGADEYECRRDDNGGGFNLFAGPQPRLTISWFSADGEDTDELVVHREPATLLVVEGKKATISAKDAF